MLKIVHPHGICQNLNTLQLFFTESPVLFTSSDACLPPNEYVYSSLSFNSAFEIYWNIYSGCHKTRQAWFLPSVYTLRGKI